MKLLTKEIKEKLPKLHETDGKEKNFVVKFFTPDANWTWYAVEGQQEEDDFIFFGLVIGLEKEWGYFSLRDLETIRGKLGLPVERDRFYSVEKFREHEAS